MLSIITKILGTFLKDIVILCFYFFALFFLSPIMLYVAFISISKRIKNQFIFLLIIFIIFNMIIIVFIGLSAVFWIRGVIHDISFSYVLYNIIRVQWLYLIPAWIYFLIFGILRLIRLKETWQEWISWYEMNN